MVEQATHHLGRHTRVRGPRSHSSHAMKMSWATMKLAVREYEGDGGDVG